MVDTLEIEENDFVGAILDRVHQRRKQVVHVQEETVGSLLMKVEDPTQNRDAGLDKGGGDWRSRRTGEEEEKVKEEEEEGEK